MKLGLNFVGPVKKTRHTGKRYILVATNYATKWVEAQALQTNSAQETAQFLYEAILTRFGCPLHLVSDQGSHFLNGTIQVLTEHFLLRHTTSTTYYPQGNGQAESTNKVIVTMLQKLVNDNRTDWDIQLYTVLFSYQTAYKVATDHSPFKLVYGLLPLMPTEYIVPTQRTTTDLDFTQHRVLAARIADLDKLDETRLKAQTHQGQTQWNRAQWIQTQGKPHQFCTTSGRSGGILHTSWPWLLTMVAAAAPILGTQVAPGCGTRRAPSPPLFAFSCPRLHPRPLVHELLAVDLASLCHLPWINPFLYLKSKICFSAPSTLAFKRDK